MRAAVAIGLLIWLVAPAAGAAEASWDRVLVVGMRIKVKGTLAADGSFEAEKLGAKDAADRDVELTGPIASLEADGFRVNGVKVVISEGALDRRGRRVAQRLEPGDWVRAEGDPQGGALLADHLQRLSKPEKLSAVEGPLEAVESDASGAWLLRLGSIPVRIAKEATWKDSD